MQNNLVIVESPAKAKTIEKFLGKDFMVTSSFGHIRDLPKKNLGINLDKNYTPEYEVSEDKTKVVNELKKMAKNAQTVWLASDEDREGEAIAWHLYEVLGLKDDKTKRIVFHEITKEAILRAIENPRKIDLDLVNAQQARRILDRLVGFELSPVLWRKIKPSLSAGRVQSVAVRLIVEREREITGFKSSFDYRIVAIFKVTDDKGKVYDLKAELDTKFNTKDLALAFLKKCTDATFTIQSIETKPAKRSPAPPFTTSTLQQEASRKLGFSVSRTMIIAQNLYESGKITYMRTDSVNLSETALNAAKEQIVSEYGEKYSNTRNYKTKSKGAQEAHEAIRPSYMNQSTVDGNKDEKSLYELIWKRTIASQMSDAVLERTTATIGINTTSENFVAVGEVIKFDGFLKVYQESTDDDKEVESKSILPPIKNGQVLNMDNIAATQRFTHYPPRYTEASLVKKLEELGIGRPSTYAPTISTIQNRDYVLKESREGEKRQYDFIVLKNKSIKEEVKTEITGAEKNKLFPTDIGMVVNDFLVENFKDIVNFNFTADVEKEFDEIAEGKIKWTKMIDKFYIDFHQKVETTMEVKERSTGEKILGTEPGTGKQISVRIGRFGPMVQIGTKDDTDKPRFASLLKGQMIETITLEEAMSLFKLPRVIGQHEGKDVSAGIGRFGPYIKYGDTFASLKKEDDPLTITLEEAMKLIADKEEAASKKVLKQFETDKELQILNGRWGPYIVYKGNNYKIPKGKKAEDMSQEDCMELIGNTVDTKAKNALKTFAEDKELQILNGRYGAYLVHKGVNFKLPKDKKPEDFTYAECKKIVEETEKPVTKAAAKKTTAPKTTTKKK